MPQSLRHSRIMSTLMIVYHLVILGHCFLLQSLDSADGTIPCEGFDGDRSLPIRRLSIADRAQWPSGITDISHCSAHRGSVAFDFAVSLIGEGRLLRDPEKRTANTICLLLAICLTDTT